MGRFFYLIIGRLIEKLSFGYLSVTPTFLRQPVNQRATEYGWVLSNLWRIDGTKILDIGAGNSPFALAARRSGYEVIPIDKRRIPSVIQADATNLPWPKESFEGVTLISVIEHTDSHTNKQIIDEIWRVLKPEGILFLTTEFSWDGERKGNGVRIFTMDSLKALLKDFLLIQVKFFASIDKSGNRISAKPVEIPKDADGIMVLAKPRKR